MSALALAFLSAVCGGFANLFARRLVPLSQARNMLSINFAIMTLMILPAAPWFFEFHLDWRGLILLSAAIVLDGLANYGYFRSFERMSAVTASGFLALSPLFAAGISPFFVKQSGSLGILQILAVFLFTAGAVFMISGFKNRLEAIEKSSLKEAVFPLGSALLFAVSMYLVKELFAGNYLNPYTYYLIRAAAISIISWGIIKPDLSWLNFKNLFLTSNRLAFVIGQWLFLLSALQTGHPAIVRAVADLSPVIVLIFSWSFLHEKPSLMQGIGLSIIVLGGILII
ncbi:MAG: DMT family transporter [Chloroflexota bacterium]